MSPSVFITETTSCEKVRRVTQTRKRTQLSCENVTHRLLGRPCDCYVTASYRHHVFMTVRKLDCVLRQILCRISSKIISNLTSAKVQLMSISLSVYRDEYCGGNGSITGDNVQNSFHMCEHLTQQSYNLYQCFSTILITQNK
jgi:hypothetical protein